MLRGGLEPRASEYKPCGVDTMVQNLMVWLQWFRTSTMVRIATEKKNIAMETGNRTRKSRF